MSYCASAAMCAGRSRRASSPPCTFGCSVLTRPSSISGKPVSAAISVTARPAPSSSLAVPPVESKVTPSAARPCASSTTPVLSETEISARMRGRSLGQLVVDELAPQRVAVDAEPLGRLALVAFGLGHHDLEQRALDHAQDHLVHRGGLDAAQVLEIAI